MDPSTRARIPAVPVRGARGAVVSPHHLATQAGIAMLRAGGSAVDAAIATNAALAVVAGADCGLGGDAFWLIWDPGAARAYALNGSGRSGRAASIEAVRADGHAEMPEVGRWTVTVPGAVDSWDRAHERFGRLDWPALLEPAIELAAGFPAGPAWIRHVDDSVERFGADGDWAAVYRPHGRTPDVGDVVRLPALGDTLRRMADDGARSTYDGAIAASTARTFARAGVPIDASDLSEHAATWAAPIGLDYRSVRSLTHPPNSVGVVALQTLGILGRAAPAPTARFDGRGWDDAEWVHRGLEASRLTLAERDAAVTDPDHMSIDVAELLADDRLDRLAARIDPRRSLTARSPTLASGGDTVHLATADRWGGVVSMLQSNFRSFGSGLVDPATGICFQNRGAFFRLDPRHPNALAPGKRPTHTLLPGLLLRDGRPWIAHGSMGGEIQPQIFAQFVSAVVDGGADVATAVAAPRWAAMMAGTLGAPSRTVLESRVDARVEARLRALGHAVDMIDEWSGGLGHGHAIELIEGDGWRSFAAASDPRSEGSAAAL